MWVGDYITPGVGFAFLLDELLEGFIKVGEGGGGFGVLEQFRTARAVAVEHLEVMLRSNLWYAVVGGLNEDAVQVLVGMKRRGSDA